MALMNLETGTDLCIRCERGRLMKISICVALLCLLSAAADAQTYPGSSTRIRELSPSPAALSKPTPALAMALKGQGHYTLDEWRRLIDSVWGQGMSTELKLQTFDTYWSKVDQTWGAFPNLVVNWDSLKNVYRPLVASGVSRGRFYGILSRLTRELNEWHVYLKDTGIDAGMGYYSEVLSEYPNYPSFRYQSGVPILNLNALVFRTPFGAGVTALPDSTALVYSVMPGHPLNLQPGDILLGYDGVPWKRLIRELFDAELPVLKGGQGVSASPASLEHASIMTAGMNWGLFDTIDVVKYQTNDTVHYPTSLLKTIAPPYFIATEQISVPGVAFPDLQSNKLVSWGVVQGTSIGYIYAWDWFGVPQGNTKVLFGQAVDELMHQRNVRGLILDFRTNWGGWPDYANDGFKHLFNVDPTTNYGSAYRVTGGGHLAFTIHPPWTSDYFTPTPEIFDHPIAVLTGPACGSSGDYNAFRLRFHPMVRFFGKPTSGAYTDFSVVPEFSSNTYRGRVDNGCVYSKYNNEGYMVHKPFPVDEEVWFTRDGVAKGEDDVVKHALQWMNTFSYVHDASLLNPYARPGVDSLTVTAVLTNPGNHSMAASLVIKNISGVVQDSAAMMNDGLHGDGLPGDSILGARLKAPSTEGFYTIDLRTRDNTIGASRLLPAVSVITTAGPVACVGDTSSTTPQWGLIVDFRLKISNKGTTTSIPAIEGTIRSLDTAATLTSSNPSFTVGDITPKEVRISSPIRIAFSTWSAGTRDIRFELLFSSNATQYWRDTITIRLVDPTGFAHEQEQIPATYELDQNYPNPFNPSTTIRYGLPHKSALQLTVFNALGQQVALLENGEQEAGYHEVQFDGSRLPSGVYFYRLRAGDFVQTKRLMILK